MNENAACQPDAEAAATCAAQSNATFGCEVCDPVDGPCYVAFGVTTETTSWVWLNELNAASFATHSDWRIPTTDELLSIKDWTRGQCGGEGGACVDPVFEPTSLSEYGTALELFPCCAFYVNFSSAYDVSEGYNKTAPVQIRAVRGSLP